MNDQRLNFKALPEWAPYWVERARLLRETEGWYIPKDKDLDDILQKEKALTIVQKIRIMLLIDRQP